MDRQENKRRHVLQIWEWRRGLWDWEWQQMFWKWQLQVTANMIYLDKER